MKIVLYIGTDKAFCEYFSRCFDNLGIIYNIDYDYFGYKIDLVCNDICSIMDLMVEFYIEFHLKNHILSKVYDEYPLLDIDDAAYIMCILSKKLVDKSVFLKMKKQLETNKILHVDSYLMFNIKIIMLTIYDVIDEICEKRSYEKERMRFLELLRTYSSLSYNTTECANVEFSSESECYITFDNDKPVHVSNDEIINHLISRSPHNISIKGEHYSPELSGIIKEIFIKNTIE